MCYGNPLPLPLPLTEFLECTGDNVTMRYVSSRLTVTLGEVKFCCRLKSNPKI